MFWRGIHKFSHIEVAPGGQAIGFGDYNTKGRTYFVNNITGATNRDGLSWDNAFAEVSEAITAAETFRQEAATNNEFVRNTIVIQGTATAYGELTALPNYCDMIGIGADARGNGAGIVRIGADADGGGAVDGVNADACRGTFFYNIQFQAGSVKAAFDCTLVYRCRFVNCAFMGNNDAASPSAGLLIGKASGLVVESCHWGGAATGGDFTIGISITGTHFHNSKVSNCHIIGVTGINIASGCNSGWASFFKDNTIVSGYTTQTASINDDATIGFIRYFGNYYQVKPTLAHDANIRCFANYLVNSATPHETFTNV